MYKIFVSQGVKWS